MIEIIIVSWDFGARMVTRPETPNHARQMLPQDQGHWGMDVYKNKVHYFVENHQSQDSVLGLWGPSGVGKTRFLTLIMQWYGFSGDASFRHVLPIQDGTVRDMQHCLAVLSKLDWATISSSEEERYRAKVISDRLKRDSFLLLLDDVQDGHADLAAVGLPMPLGPRQKIVMATRSKVVCARMGCTLENTVEMHCLGDDDAWSLFMYAAGVEISDEADTEIYKIAKEMVSSCEGFPRAIRAIGLGIAGATLCGKDPDDWRYAYDHFKAMNLPPDRMEELTSVL